MTTLVKTNRIRHPEFLAPAPLYTGPVTVGQDHHERAVLPDGSIVWVVGEVTGAVGLYRELVARDYGGNEYTRRTADKLAVGIAAPPPGLPPLLVSGDGLVGWLDC